jgi:hypothetical protein
MDSLIVGMTALSIGKTQPKIIEIKMHDTGEVVQITLPRKRFYKRTVIGFKEVDEVEQGVRDWYAALGLPVPEADLIFMREMKVAEAAEEKAAEERAKAETEAPQVSEEMPPHGTPEFWAWCRRRTAANNAERAAAGLPPLPTAAEKKKEAEKKAAEKAAKLSAKLSAKT